jgi:hypothetical protein
MAELTEFSLSEIDENSGISGLEEHSLRVKVSLDYTNSTVRSQMDSSLIREESSVLPPKVMKRASSITACNEKNSSQVKHSRNTSTTCLSPRNHLMTFTTPTKSRPSLPKSSGFNMQKRFEETFERTLNSIDLSPETSSSTFVTFLHMLGFLKVQENTGETSELFKIFQSSPTAESIKSVLLGILGLNEGMSAVEKRSLKEKFSGLYSGYFKSKRKPSVETFKTPKSSPRASFTYKIVKHSEVVKENYDSIAEYLLSYQKTLETKLEKTTEKVNKEKYKECTFKPNINKKSKHLDSTPKCTKQVPYISLKEELNTTRTKTLYEFAEVSRHLRNESIKQFINEESLKFAHSPSVKVLKSKENTPVKGMDEVVKRMNKARAEKEWKTSIMERGVTICKKEKENNGKDFEVISEIELTLQGGAKDSIKYCKGDNIGFLVNEFCLKHRLRPEFHEKIVKIMMKAKGRESHQLNSN